MFGRFGSSEIIIVAIVILVFFGGKKLPDFIRNVRKAIQEFKDASSDSDEDDKNS